MVRSLGNKAAAQQHVQQAKQNSSSKPSTEPCNEFEQFKNLVEDGLGLRGQSICLRENLQTGDHFYEVSYQGKSLIYNAGINENDGQGSFQYAPREVSGEVNFEYNFCTETTDDFMTKMAQ